MTTESSERRRNLRRKVWFPMEIAEGERRKRIAVSHNASESGILLASRSRFELGDEVVLRFKVRPSDEIQELTGIVVRYEEDVDADLWPHVVAVRFSQNADDLGACLDHASAS